MHTTWYNEEHIQNFVFLWMLDQFVILCFDMNCPTISYLEQVATCYMGDLLQSSAQIYQPYFSDCCSAFRFLGWVMVSPHLAPADKFSIVRASPAAMVKWLVASSFQWAKCQSGVKMDLLLQTCTLRTKVSKDWINENDCFVSGPMSKIGLALNIDWLATGY